MSAVQTLPGWLDQDAAALAGPVPPGRTLAGALPGLAQARELTPLQRLQRAQDSGLAESSGSGEPTLCGLAPVSARRLPTVLVIDATGLDARAAAQPRSSMALRGCWPRGADRRWACATAARFSCASRPS